MCLITDWNEPHIAEKDIVCYKWYVKTIYDFDYKSPYQNSSIPTFGIVARSELDSPKEYKPPYVCEKARYKVFKGFHSFVKFEDACKSIHEFFTSQLDYLIAICVIPKGAKYYKGYYSDKESYCSDSIIIKTSVEE